ncbi:MAG TPA: dihydrodipicolinate synthase family protein, partial [Chlamydiales bacterium]|nr:dihydrodipicolinate synthase family protein [Chlamydiales bacterium]
FARKLIGAIDIPVYCGDDALTLEMIKLGAKGTISVVSNIIPNEWEEMVRVALSGNWEKASEIDKRYRPLVDALGLEVNPIGVKYALSALGLCAPHMRLPLCEPLEETKRAINEVLFHR